MSSGAPSDGGQLERRPIRPALLAIVAALAGMAVMSPALGGPYIFDDELLIPFNHYVHDFGHWRHWLTGRLWDTNFDVTMLETRSFWRPLVTASYALDWQTGGGSPLTYHATNLLVHAANAALTFVLASRWLSSSAGALVAALVFAVHPAQTESVAWIAGRTDSLCTLGMLVATLGVRVSRERRWAGLGMQLVGSAIALSSKEMAVVLPILITVERWSERRNALTGREVGRLARLVAPYAALSLAFAIGHHAIAGSEPTDAAVSTANRLPLILDAYGRYVSLAIWPADLTMGWALLRVDGDSYAPHLGYASLGLASLIAATAFGLRERKRRPLLSLLLFGFLGALLPVSGVVWLGYKVLVAPRFLYVPLLLLGVALGMLACKGLVQRRPVRRAALGLTAVVLACLATRAAWRAGDYASTESFWRREIEHNPHFGPAQEHFISRELQASRPHAALRLARAWYESPPDVPSWSREKLIVKTLASLLALTPDLDRDTLDAVQRFATSLVAGKPAGLSLPAHGVRLEARGARLLNRLGAEQRTLRVIAAEAAVRLGDDDAALEQIAHALVGCESCWSLLSTSALITAQAGRTRQATELARRAGELAPPGQLEGLAARLRAADAWKQRVDSQPSAFNRAAFHAAVGSYGRAYRAAAAAFAAPPDDPTATAKLAQLAYQAGDPRRARALLEAVYPRVETERLLGEFSRRVRWLDRPSAEPHWLPSLPAPGA